MTTKPAAKGNESRSTRLESPASGRLPSEASGKSKFGISLPIAISFAAVVVSAAQVWVAHEQDRQELERGILSRNTDLLSGAVVQLGATRDGEIDLGTRLSGITALTLLTYEDLPTPYFQQAAEVLTAYVRNNIESRKKPGFGTNEERRETVEGTVITYKPTDIVAALKALQAIRHATNGKVPITLNAIDFSRIRLVDLDLSGFDFTHCRFKGAFLTRSSFRGATMTHAVFEDVRSWNADFEGANLARARFVDALFVNPNFANSNFHLANELRFRQFDGARGLSPEQTSRVLVAPGRRP